ncbi:MAG: lytic transglycosylase domain-containing protein [Acidobacteria bacterium]|nr:lytic transglycosylase domain-containing protein [Acidobacteriota bacterium]
MGSRRVGALVGALTLLGSISGAAGSPVQRTEPIDAEGGEPEALTIENVNALVGAGELAEGVESVSISGNGYEEAAQGFVDTVVRSTEVELAVDEVGEARAERSSERTTMAGERVRLESEHVDAGIESVDKARAISDLAVAAYMATGSDRDPALAIFGEDGLVEGFLHQQLRENATEHQSERLVVAQLEERTLSEQRVELDASIDANAGAIAELDARADRLAIERVNLYVQLLADAQAVRDTRLLADVIGTDFPVVALDAYVSAANRAYEDTNCGIQWWMIAAVGKTESGHGTARGSSLESNGSTTVEIIGIPLDGTGGTARIKDTDGGELDGNASFDHAVGPMQFIPQTWNRVGIDGNDDEEIDPHNLYDAAATTARYLCRGRSMTTEEDMRAGYFSYNHQEEYVEAVLARALAYQALNLGL